VDTVAQDIHRDMDKYFECGACTADCPTGSLHIEHPSVHLMFDPEKSSGGELGVNACPVRAMIVTIDRAEAL
jgi:ferredoxin